MPTDQLVLFKSRRQRLTEQIVMSIAFLPVGPLMRALLGDGYLFFYGLAAQLLMEIVVTRLSSHWAARHGGEWVTNAERLRRLVAETAGTPRWPNALATTATMALMLLGVLLTIEPLDHLGDAFGGTFYAIGAVTALSVLAGARVLLAGRSQRQLVSADEAPPSGYFWPELRSTLPLDYAAYTLGAIAAYIIAVQLQETIRYVAFIVMFLITSQLLLMLRRRTPKRIYPILLDAHLGRRVLAGVLLWGIPMGIMFSAATALDNIGHLAQRIALAMSLSAIGGGAIGVLMHVIDRLSGSRKAQ